MDACLVNLFRSSSGMIHWRGDMNDGVHACYANSQINNWD